MRKEGAGKKKRKGSETAGKLTSTVTLLDVSLTRGKLSVVVHPELLLVPRLAR